MIEALITGPVVPPDQIWHVQAAFVDLDLDIASAVTLQLQLVLGPGVVTLTAERTALVGERKTSSTDHVLALDRTVSLFPGQALGAETSVSGSMRLRATWWTDYLEPFQSGALDAAGRLPQLRP